MASGKVYDVNVSGVKKKGFLRSAGIAVRGEDKFDWYGDSARGDF